MITHNLLNSCALEENDDSYLQLLLQGVLSYLKKTLTVTSKEAAPSVSSNFDETLKSLPILARCIEGTYTFLLFYTDR